MIIINSLNESRFTFNGVQYFKNYVTKIAGDKLTIYNTYNNKDVLVPLTPFDQFRVNGSVYDTIEELQIAIIGICYTRTTLDEGSPNGQNNIGRYLSFGEIAGGNDYITPTDVATFINNLDYSIVITAIDAPVTFDFTRNGVRYLFDFTPGKGMWGSASGANFGGTVQSFHFKLKSVFKITPTDIEDNQGATIISLGDIPTGDYLTKANSVQRDFNDAGELDENGSVISYYFSYTTDTILYFIQFVGAAGVYNGTLVADDLVSTTNNNVTIEVDYENVLQTGNFASIGAIHKDTDTGMITEFHGSGFGSTLGDYTQKFLVDTPVGDYTITFPAATQNDNVVYESALHEGLNGLDLQAITDNGSSTTNSITTGGITSNGNINLISYNGSYIYTDEEIGLVIGGGSNGLSFSSLDGFSAGSNGDITVNAGNGGFKYDADYSAYYTDRSLVDKEYVNNQVGNPIPLTGTEEGNPVTGNLEFDASSTVGLNANAGGQITFNNTEGVYISGNASNVSISSTGGSILVGYGSVIIGPNLKSTGNTYVDYIRDINDTTNDGNVIELNNNGDLYITGREDVNLTAGNTGKFLFLGDDYQINTNTLKVSSETSFSSTPTTIIDTPTLDTHLTNKKYVDDSLPSGVGFGYWNGTDVSFLNGNSQQMVLGNGTISDIDTKMRSQWIGINTGSNTPVTSSTNFQEAIWSLQAQVENAIPLSGTEEGNPVTGDIEFDGFLGIKWLQPDGLDYNMSINNTDEYLKMQIDDLTSSEYTSFFLSGLDGNLSIETNISGAKGITSTTDFTSNITALDYVQKKYVDDVAIQDLQNVTDTGATTTNTITTGGLSIPTGTLNITDGNSSHYIKGDGTASSFSYAVKTNLVGSHTVADGSTDQITELSQVRNAFYQLQNQINTNADNAIPLTGTEVGSPITGNIELSDTNKIELNGSIVNSYIQFSDEDGWLQFSTTDISSGAFSGFTVEGGSTQIVVNDGVGITKSFNIDYERGIRSNSDFTPNITDLDYVQKKYVDTKESKGKLTQGISSSSTIDFVSYKQFGTRTTPVTVDVTLNTTDAVQGIIQVIYHNAASFTPPAGTTIVGNTPYVPNVLNMICMRYISETVEIWYTQDQ
ncbi:hypothetical protein DVK85_06630 [Flavobacterium arcticum]|uniref:Uncharacterized protein n=1 Tax=Flavobacterium arcticum TaxID=1784713 RepID=A0A345HBH5_9FLAO|nr:hypothetical protein [Flavobacterium arcticum]AXG73935.1 hypothetical protein DVK85_06630 [Flavobacterium arcticum]KAF2508911.1 hypothetical protein E0W72_10115 [Flavobacterium arcticum]